MRRPQPRDRFGAPDRTSRAPALLVAVLVAVLLFPPLSAQPLDPEIEPMFGIGDDEFLIGGWSMAFPASAASAADSAAQSIQWARNLGVNVWRMPISRVDSAQLTTLLNAADTTNDIRFIMCGVPEGDQASYGIEAKFYLVPDSVPFRHWPCKFLYLNGGQTVTNPDEEDDWKQEPKEQVYDRDLVAVNTTIADSIVLDWSPSKTSWWSQVQNGSGDWCRVSPHEQARQPGSDYGLFWNGRSKGTGNWGSTTYVVVTGHLDGNEIPQANADSTVLWIDVFYDIGRQESYVHPQTLAVVTASDNISVLCTTLVVKQSDLAPPGGSPDYSTYRSVSLAFDAEACTPTIPGPLKAGSDSKRINLRVRYAGNATVALRSIALRDEKAQEVLSLGPWATAQRDAALSSYEEFILDGGDLRTSVIAIAADGEQSPSQAAAVTEVNSWFQSEYHQIPDPHNDSRLDTLGVWIENPYREGTYQQLSYRDRFGRLTSVAQEFLNPQDVVARWLIPGVYGQARGAVWQHNGGRWQLPLLVLHPDSVEEFERNVQLRHLKQYLPTPPVWLPAAYTSFVAEHARVARDARKRLIAIPFLSNNFWIRRSTTGGDFPPLNNDSAIGTERILEAAEIRNAANMSLAMGAKGIFWQVISSPTNILDTDGGFYSGYLNDWGATGPTTADTSTDFFPSLGFTTEFDDTVRITLNDFWTGWGVRYRAVQQYNRWLKQVGPELMRLTWRDVYSMHATVPIRFFHAHQAGCGPGSGFDQYTNVDDTLPARPVPSNEIFTSVTTTSPVTGLTDPDSATYVEVGLFDMKPGWRRASPTSPWVSDQMLDTHHFVLIQRRVFEPSDDITDSAARDSMLALVGTRHIDVKLNLMKFGEFTFCRVQEIAADTSRLPGASGPRTALDTIIPADSIFRLTLGPGRAALIRVTYLQWDTTILAGRAELPNQRKIVWDPWQRRFHATYMKAHDTSRRDGVYYRRSRVLADTTGSILWEPQEYELSHNGIITDSIQANRHPSLTIRRVPSGAIGGGGTFVTVVWTAHRTSVWYAARQVLLRMVKSPDSKLSVDTSHIIEVVDSAIAGEPYNRWGTPVVSRADGADIIAWSDSTFGIKAVARVVNNYFNDPQWWRQQAAYTDTVHISDPFGNDTMGTNGIYPSVPSFAHIDAHDSNVAIVWEQPNHDMVVTTQGSGQNRYPASDIYYSRLQHATIGGVDTLLVVNGSTVQLSRNVLAHRNPSITQHQDHDRNVLEVVVWERGSHFLDSSNFKDRSWLTIRSIQTDTKHPNPGISYRVMGRPPQAVTLIEVLRELEGFDWLYPNIASIGYRDSTDIHTAMSTISHRWKNAPPLPYRSKELQYDWGTVDTTGTRQYTFGGNFPTNSETPTQQKYRHALLYETGEDEVAPRLFTSREFYFARGRPQGYTAEGRELQLRMDDSIGCGFSFLMLDPWMSNETESLPVEMVARDTSTRIVSDFDVARTLLRTNSFAATDSTEVGISLSATFDGDTTNNSARTATYVVELVDAATDAPVHVLDSFRISTTYRTHIVIVVDTLDLVSGTYYIRARVDTVGVEVPVITTDSRYPVADVFMEVENSQPPFKLRRVVETGEPDLRLTTHPNPAAERAETRFTVPADARVRVVFSAAGGSHAATIHDEWMTAGRYAVEIDTRGLRPGVYVVQVHVGSHAELSKVVVGP